MSTAAPLTCRNMPSSCCDGCCHLQTALQNHTKLCLGQFEVAQPKRAVGMLGAHVAQALRVLVDHTAEPAERRVLLFVVLDLPKSGAPRLRERGQVRGDLARAHESDTTNGDRRVLGERLGRLGVEKDRDQPLDECLHERFEWRRVTGVLQRNLAHCPGSVVAHADTVGIRLRDNLLNDGGHDLRDGGLEKSKARYCHVAEEGVS